MPEIDQLLKRIEEQAQAARRRSLILTAIPVLAGVAFLVVTMGQVADARRDLRNTQSQIDKKKEELAALQRDLDQKKRELDFLGKALWNAGQATAMEAINKAVDDEPSLAQVAGRVYLHIREESQRPKARAIGKRLQAQGYIVPGIERLPKGPARSEVKYFKQADAAEGKRLAEDLRQAGVADAQAVYAEGYENSGRVRRRHFEVWLGPAGG